MKNIRRNTSQTGWYIPAYLGTKRQKFLDVDFGSSEQSYAAAVREFETEDQHTGRKMEMSVRSNKRSTDEVGITHYTVKDGQQIKHRFAVCNPITGKPVMIYIGNANTFQKNYERKLVEALELRDRLREEHRTQQT